MKVIDWSLGREKQSSWVGNKQSSVIDIQREELPDDVWDKDSDGNYSLKTKFKDEIVERATNFTADVFNVDDPKFIDSIYLVSSIGTYFYSDTTDIDIKVIIDFDKLYKQKPGLRNISEDLIMEYFIDEISDKDHKHMTAPVEGSIRELDWYAYEKEDFDSFKERKAPRFDSIYDVTDDTWYKFTPPIEDLSETEVFEYAVDLSKEILSTIDLKVGKLKRFTVDYDYFRNFLKKVNPESPSVKAKLEETVQEIENIMQDISDEKENYSDLRKHMFDEEKLVDTFSKVYNSVNFSDVNLMRKVLEHYGYWFTIIQLNKIWGKADEKVDAKFMKGLGDLLKTL